MSKYSFRLNKIILILAVLVFLLPGCTSGPLPDQSTFTPPAPVAQLVQESPLPPTDTPAPELVVPADATVVPEEPTLSVPLQPYTTATLEKLSNNCLRSSDYEPIVNRFLVSERQANLKDLWAKYEGITTVYGLMSSLTDAATNTYAHATTYSRMLLVGEYPVAINRPGAVGYLHCAVLIYMGGDEPEIGVGITDATLNETWSGFGYGLVRSEAEMRQYIQDRIGKILVVRYMVSQDPRDVNFVRSGFFSPVMKLLWQNSYYTRFSQNPDMLKDNVGQPRGPSMKELMILLSSWPDQDAGIFLDYIIDPIL